MPEHATSALPTPNPPAPERDEFYVGYLPLPQDHRRFVRILVPALLWALVFISLATAWRMRSAGDGMWQSGHQQQWTGVLRTRPYPMLEVHAPGGVETYLLVEMGKRGSAERVARLADADGAPTRTTGWLLHRDERRIIELAPDESALALTGSTIDPTVPLPPRPQSLGAVTLRGEIVDSKCYLGAMKPGDGKAHKACATLCITGGIPPMFVTTDSAGRRAYYLITSSDGGPAGEEIMPLIGEPVEIRGEVTRSGDLLRLSMTPGSLRRL